MITRRNARDCPPELAFALAQAVDEDGHRLPVPDSINASRGESPDVSDLWMSKGEPPPEWNAEPSWCWSAAKARRVHKRESREPDGAVDAGGDEALPF